MGMIRSTKKNNYVVQFRENSGLVCEWELREANLLICFAGAQLFKALRWNVIKTGISESYAGSCTCSAPFPLTLERTLWTCCAGCIEWFKLG